MSLTISVVTPSLNQGQFIERTIQSVHSQGMPVEHIVIDGGSTDQTISILQQYDDRLIWLSEPDDGQAGAVNKGIIRSSGDVIGWLNSDDVYYPGALQTVMQCFAENPEIDVIYGQAHLVDVNDQVIEIYPTEPWNTDRLKETCFLCQPAVFFRRTVAQMNGLLNPSLQYCMDYEYWIRLADQCQFYYLRQPLAGSRMYPTNKTVGQRAAVHLEINNMLANQLGTVPDRWVFACAETVVDSWRTFRHRKRPYRIVTACLSCIYFMKWCGAIPDTAVPTLLDWITPRVLKRKQ